MQSKFKVGDRVIFYRDASENKTNRNYFLNNSALTLKRREGESGYGSTESWTVEEVSNWIFRDNEIEHEAIYNSPLYKALL